MASNPAYEQTRCAGDIVVTSPVYGNNYSPAQSGSNIPRRQAPIASRTRTCNSCGTIVRPSHQHCQSCSANAHPPANPPSRSQQNWGPSNHHQQMAYPNRPDQYMPSPLDHRRFPASNKVMPQYPIYTSVPGLPPPGHSHSNLDHPFPPFPSASGKLKVVDVYQLAGFQRAQNVQNAQEINPEYDDKELYNQPFNNRQNYQNPPYETAPSSHPAQYQHAEMKISRPEYRNQPAPVPTSNENLFNPMSLAQQHMPEPEARIPRESYGQTAQMRHPPRATSISSTSTSTSSNSTTSGRSAVSARSAGSGGFSSMSSTASTPVNVQPMETHSKSDIHGQHSLAPQHLEAQQSLTVNGVRGLHSDEYMIRDEVDEYDEYDEAGDSEDELPTPARVRILSQLQMSLNNGPVQFNSQPAPLQSSNLVVPSGNRTQLPSNLSPITEDAPISTQAPAHAPLPKRKPATCLACSKPIHGKSIRAPPASQRPADKPALRGKWHRDCFRCVYCHSSFGSLECFLTSNGLPCCESCYHSVNGSICIFCHQGIIGTSVVVSDDGGSLQDGVQMAHLSCFRCVECGTVLRETFYETAPGVFMCEVHANQTYQKAQAQEYATQSLTDPGGNSLYPMSQFPSTTNRAERRITRTIQVSKPIGAPLTNNFQYGTPF
ncbi:uncharacterized protein V1516DRAFT_661814 [Lipomyces oligophaga]|uniref:uncharacterized protein n=1 Tax=Lipomyces oligophaga TaxID=45792 RepID=UPI0034CEE74D